MPKPNRSRQCTIACVSSLHNAPVKITGLLARAARIRARFVRLLEPGRTRVEWLGRVGGTISTRFGSMVPSTMRAPGRLRNGPDPVLWGFAPCRSVFLQQAQDGWSAAITIIAGLPEDDGFREELKPILCAESHPRTIIRDRRRESGHRQG